MKKVVLFFSAILFIAVNSFAQSPVQKAKNILDAVNKKYKSKPAFRAKFIYTMSNQTEGINESFKGEIKVKNDMYYLKLPDQHVINDGETVWTYIKDANEINISEYDPDEEDITPSSIYSIYESGKYDYAYVEKKVEQGKTYHVIDLKPKNRNQKIFKIRLKITTGNSLKSWEIFEKNNTRYLYYITYFATPKGTYASSSFKLNKANYPSDVLIEDLR